jgi:4'-phosphopantetheinyl transferase
VYLAHRRHLQHSHVALLNGAETERCGRYRLAADRARFTLAAALLRAVAGRATGDDPAAIVVDRTCHTCGDPHGRPRLPGTRLEASISHSGDIVAVALAEAGPVGVDIEQLSAADYSDLTSTVCTTVEQRNLYTVDDFYSYWTRKEAVLKATGEGLARRMTSIEVTPPDDPPAIVTMDGATGISSRMIDLRIDGYAGAVAVLGSSAVSFAVFDAAEILMAAGG